MEAGSSDKTTTDAGSAFDGAREAFGSTLSGFAETAGERAREFTVQGKDKTTETLDSVATLISDAAGAIDEKLGAQYAGYVRKAADAVTGVSDTLKQKDADQLFEDAKGLIRSSPAIAIAAAAAVGFVVARVVKAGFDTPSSAGPTAYDPPAADSSPETPKA
jgi:ElaB/YqjD/DUF883 family membrane-anchored ribosome-binding protein